MNDNVNTSPETQVEGQAQETEVQEVKTFTEAEVQSMIDQRVTQALKTAERKNEAKMREAEKLAKMNDNDRREYEYNQRLAALEAKEREFALLENKNEASKILAEKGLSLALVDFIVAEDADTMSNNIKILEQAFKASVKAEVEKRMGGSTPRKASAVDKAMTAEEFSKLPYNEMLALKAQNPELYRQLNAQL